MTAEPSGTPQPGVSDAELQRAIASGIESSFEDDHFMVDRSGGCRVRFNLAANDSRSRFWVSEPGDAAAIGAST